MMKQTVFQKALFFSLLSTSSSFANLVLPLSGTRSGEDPELFTMLTTSPQGTNYTLRGEFLLCNYSPSSNQKQGGAFCNLEGNLTFSGTTPLSSLIFRSLSVENKGAGVFSNTPIRFERLKKIVVENCQGSGGIITGKQDICFDKNSYILFLDNVGLNHGGGIFLTGSQPSKLIFNEQSGSIAFIRNRVATSTGSGGAISSEVPGSSITFCYNEDVIFENNAAQNGGGIFNPQGAVEFAGNRAQVTFSSNRAEQDGGGIYSNSLDISRQEQGVLFYKNHAQQLGGAIQAPFITVKDNEGPVTFSQNTSSKGGGALSTSICNITATETILFSENTTGNLGGGAIYLSGSQPKLNLRAHQGDIIFQNNMMLSSAKDDSLYTHNAILIKDAPKECNLVAHENCSVIFYDPILSVACGTNPIHINTKDHTAHKGSIIFSGDQLSPNEYQNKANKTSILNQPVLLHNGILSIEGGAILAVQTFKQDGGLLNLSPGSVLTTYNNTGKEDMVIANLSFGLSNTNSQLPAEIRAGSSELVLLGSPKIYDAEESFYQDHSLASYPYHMQILLTSDKGIHTEGFSPKEIHIAHDAYGYQGSWNFSWSPEDTKKKKVLKATWIPTGQFVLDPKRKGVLVPTSLWGTFYGLQATTHAIADNYLNNNLLFPINHACCFGSVLSSITEQHSDAHGKFTTKRLGHNVGIHLPIESNTVLCGTFTKLYGHVSQPASDRAHSHMYAGTLALFKNWRAFSFRSLVTYCEESFESKLQTTKKDLSQGIWKNQGVQGAIGVSYAYPKGIHCIKITPFIDLEYTALSLTPFIETGHDPRYFSSSHLYNISLPTGVSIEIRLFGKQYSLLSQLSLAYSKDIQREDPKNQASLILNQHAWNVSGCSVGTEAISFKLRSTLKYKFLTSYLGITTTEREGHNFSGDGFGGISCSF